MNEYFLEDYENFLEYTVGFLNRGKQFIGECKIDETRGIVDNYDSIAEELFQVIVNQEPMKFNDKTAYLAYNIGNYKLRQDCFIDTLTINVLTRSEDNSFFNGNNSEILKEGMKLKNVLFRICISEKFLDCGNGKNEFMQIMAHELQHAYRFYKIMLTNQSYANQEKIRKERYQNAIVKGNEKKLEQKLMDLYYISERDEISSESNKLYEYIKQHNDITEGSYQKYEENFDLYRIIDNLESTLHMFEENRNNSELINYIGSIYKKITMINNISDNKAAMKFRTRIIDSLMFAKRNYKRTLSKAFKDFNLYIVGENLNRFKKKISWDMDEIEKELNENKEMNRILGRA